MANQRKRSGDAEEVAKTAEGERFEQQLERLETIVKEIDSGELSLEESVDAFERGVKLVRSLNRKLDEVERRVEVLTRDAGGELAGDAYDGEIDNGTAAKKSDDDIPF